MMAVQWVGRFRELTNRRDDLSILDSIDKVSAAQATAVAEYLRSGHGLIDVMEIRPDVVDGTPVSETASVLGDGAWIWREDLAHYVEKYQVALDPSFVASIRGSVPDVDEDTMARAIEEAMQLWQEG